MMLAFSALSNAFGMVPPVYTLEENLAGWLNTRSEALVLFLIFGTTNLLLPAGLGLGAAWLSRRVVAPSGEEPLRAVFTRYAPAFVPLGLAIWLAHYLFHFAIGALTLVPVAQSFLLDHGLALLGRSPQWTLGSLVPSGWLLPLQTGMVLAGFVGSLYTVEKLSRGAYAEPNAARRAALPWLVVLLGLALGALYILSLPMEMRGTTSLY
jgi:hypothetical protein